MRFHAFRRRLDRYESVEVGGLYRDKITGSTFYVRSIGPQIQCETTFNDDFSTPRETFEAALWNDVIVRVDED